PLMPPPVRRIVVDEPVTVVRPPAPAQEPLPANGNGHADAAMLPPLVESPRRVARATEAGPERMRTDRLSVAYAGRPAVKDVTMGMRQGEVLALIGPSGCGKTTLLRSLNR